MKYEELLRSIQKTQADDRAHRIASAAASEFVRSDGMPSAHPDGYIIARPYDDFGHDCLEHLKWHGEAVVLETEEDDYLEVIFGDYPLGSFE